MSVEYYRRGPIKEAFVISTLLHLLLFLVSSFVKIPEPTILSFNIQLIETEKRVPQEVKQEIQRAIEKVEQEKRDVQLKKKMAQQSWQTTSTAAGEPIRGKEQLTEEERFTRDFERTLYAKDSSRLLPQAENKIGKEHNWEEDAKAGNYGKTEKTKIGETVKIPEGKTKTNHLKWRSGYQRRITYLPPIEYPLYYRQQGIQAEVLLSIEVDPSGQVVEVDIMKSSGYPKLDIIAKNAIRQARFTSVMGATTNDVGEIEIRFILH